MVVKKGDTTEVWGCQSARSLNETGEKAQKLGSLIYQTLTVSETKSLKNSKAPKDRTLFNLKTGKLLEQCRKLEGRQNRKSFRDVVL